MTKRIRLLIVGLLATATTAAVLGEMVEAAAEASATRAVDTMAAGQVAGDRQPVVYAGITLNALD